MAGCSSGVGNELSDGTDDGEHILSMVDVLQADNDLEEEANAVLGDSDDKCCTYSQGYLGRQALYACETCLPGSTPEAAICLACSYECHEGHNLYELYTKRYVKCDCGNSKFQNLTCKLCPNKTGKNEKNIYNHNYKGLYCTCKRPYPDPDDQIEDEMIQCIICEDWYHGRHLGCGPPDYLDYQEMICIMCMEKNNFLWAYTVNSIETKIIKNNEECMHVEVENGKEESETASTKVEGERKRIDDEDEMSPPCKKSRHTTEEETPHAAGQESIKPPLNCFENEAETINNKINNKLSTTHILTLEADAGSSADNNTKSKSEDNLEADNNLKAGDNSEAGDNLEVQNVKDVTSDSTVETEVNKIESEDDRMVGSEKCCKLEDLRKRNIKEGDHATFWPSGWRTKLCTCPKCKEFYKENDLGFLPDISDTVLAYEERGKAKQAQGVTQYERGIEALSNMHRTQQIEVITEYNDLQSELKDYLRKFSEEGKVVQEEDIRQFFEGMKSRKRQRTNEGSVQAFCR